MTRINLPLIDRTVERTQGCWNCSHAERDIGEVMKRWKTHDRPQREAQIVHAKQLAAETSADPAALIRHAQTGRNEPCPCGSGAKYKRCHLDKDKNASDILRRIEGVENATRILDNLDGAIAQGIYLICKNPKAGKDYVNHRFLCDKWSAAQGASIARAGQGPDELPEELKERMGDGN